MSIDPELFALFMLCAVSSSLFDKFEVETPTWKKLARWSFAAALTLGAEFWIGHCALAVLAAFAILGSFVHFYWCSRNGIDPIGASPRQRYYELRGWSWPPGENA
jgi:hypothetical protein